MRTFYLFCAVFAVLAMAGSMIAQERVDLATIHRIKAEAFENSKVMDHEFYLTDVYGPRVAGSPNYKRAADWLMGRLKEYGLTNVHTEKFAFGRGWTYTRFSGHMIEPQYQPLIGFPLVWTPGTGGVVTADAILAEMSNEADLDKFRGKLKGKVVLTQAPRQLAMIMTPPAHRLTDEEIAQRDSNVDPSRFAIGPAAPAAAGRGGRGGAPAAPAPPPPGFRNKLNQFLKDEGAAVVLQLGSAPGDGGTVFAAQGGSRLMQDPVPPPMVALTPEHYNRIARLLQHNMPVKLQFEIEAQMLDSDQDSFNIIGEIEGGREKG